MSRQRKRKVLSRFRTVGRTLRFTRRTMARVRKALVENTSVVTMVQP